MSRGDPTTDPALTSWVPGAADGDFPIQNLPYGIFRPPGELARAGVAIGRSILDLNALDAAGLLAGAAPGGTFARASLNAFASLGPRAWGAVRTRVSELLRAGNDEIASRRVDALVPSSDVEMLPPVEVGDYVDFYSSLSHATNLGRIFRPDAEPLLPNWRHLPVGYHGRAGSVVVDGTPVVRPSGQRKPPQDPIPSFGPSARLDFELEIGFLAGPASTLGTPIPIERATDHIFGVVLVNDWSARDIQAWEYQPLGPFLGKSFATSVSPWVVSLAALAPYRVRPPAQHPPPMGYLRWSADWTLDLDLEVVLTPAGGDETVISRTNARGLYWTMAQQLAHATVNGARVRPGDLFASGTISGDEPGTYGSMIELSWNGAKPLDVAGRERSFLEDGDRVVMRGHCGGDGRPRIGFGSVSGMILPAR